MGRLLRRFAMVLLCLSFASPVYPRSDPLQDYKKPVLKDVEAMKKPTQIMIDMVFSFGELGFQEFVTSAYLTALR